MARRRWYVGWQGDLRVAFAYHKPPTRENYGSAFDKVVGPFRTKRAAEVMAKCGQDSPYCQTVRDAELLAAYLEASGEEL